MSEQVLEESSPFLANLRLAEWDIEPFFAGKGRFTTFTFFSQPVGHLLAYKYHQFSFTCHSNIANRLCFLAFATTDLVGRSNRGLAEMIAWRPLGGMREKSRLPNNFYPNEVITACQYPYIATVQIPSFYEPGMVTTVKRLLQNSKALCRRNGWT